MTYLKQLLICLISLILLACASTSQHDANVHKIDRISDEELARIMPKPIATVSLDDVLRMSKEGLSADAIIEKIRVSNSYYDLTPSQIVDLNKQGVDSKVLDYIHSSSELAARNKVAEEINKREKVKHDEIEKLKRQQMMERQQRMYDPACGYRYRGIYPYGYGAFGRRSGFGMGFGMPLGCW